MRVAEFIKSFNSRKYAIDYSRWQELKQYYMSMYRYWMVKMYDMGYIGDPTVFDEEMLIREIDEMELQGFLNQYGEFTLSSERAYFAKCITREADDQQLHQFASLLYETLKYREYWVELDKCFEMYQGKVSAPFNLCSKYGSMVYSRNNICYNKAVFSALIENDSKISRVSMNDELFKLCCRALGIKGNAPGMFIKGMSHEDEIANSKLIFNGEVDADGLYGKELTDWLIKYWVSKENVCRGLYDWVFREYSDEVVDIFERTCKGKEVIGAYEGSIFISEDLSEYTIPVSVFAVYTSAQHPDCLIEDYNSLYGYTGEVYSATYLNSEGMVATGIPLIINHDGIEIEVFDREQILDFRQNSWFGQNGLSFDYDELHTPNPFKVGDICYELFNAYKTGRQGGLYKISGYPLEEILSNRKKVINKIVNM